MKSQIALGLGMAALGFVGRWMGWEGFAEVPDACRLSYYLHVTGVMLLCLGLGTSYGRDAERCRGNYPTSKKPP